MKKTVTRWAIAVALVLGLSATLVWAQDPVATDLVERAEVSLILLDVEVRDEDGRPVPGLTLEDFDAVLNGRPHPIYSLDDFCLPPSPDEGAAAAETAPVPSPGTAPRSPSGITSFVLYLDFSQLRQDGRVAALDAAAGWVRDVMQPGERAQLVGYTSFGGTRLLTEFTDDREELLGAIERARDDIDLVDPFPVVVLNRIVCCSGLGTGPCIYMAPSCKEWAVEAVSHSRHGLESLKRYLIGLETLPGKKALLLFHQNAAIYPSRKYGISEYRIGDQVGLLDEVGAEANLSETVVYPLHTGDALSTLAGPSVNLGANLADFTGGQYNKGDADLVQAVSTAGREFSCLYRIGLVKPEARGSRVYQAKVRVRGRAAPGRYRVRFLNEVDRWWRRAQAVLTNPARATDLALRTAAVPVEATDKGWNLSVLVALDVESLMLLPGTGEHTGGWEVGALMTRDNGVKSWELLGVSSLRVGEETDAKASVVHVHAFEDLRPGSYRLAAFVRDRMASLFGGSDVTLELPNPDRPGLVGPVPMFSSRAHLQAPLPLAGNDKDAAAARAAVRQGAVPAGDGPVPAGEELEMLTWICSGVDGTPPARVIRYVSRDGDALFRLEGAMTQPAGRCVRLSDRILTAPMEPGEYVYHVRWTPDGGARALERSRAFEVVPAE